MYLPSRPRPWHRPWCPILPCLLTLILLGCTGPNPAHHDGGTEDGSGACGACGTNQICQNGQCQDLPSSCPCPKGSYCNLASNSCQAGCTDDTDCNSGEICDSATRVCVAGCRSDTQCPSGNICTAMVCRPICLTDADCRMAGEICDPTDHDCRQGCRLDSDCQKGQFCDQLTLTCATGCTSDASCGNGQCDPVTHQCACSVITQAGCDAGMKCTTHDFMSTVCDNDGPTARGQLCSETGGPDSCVAGAVCQGSGVSVCRLFCSQDATCGTRGFCDVTQGSFHLCNQPCKPVYPGSGCDTGMACRVLEDGNGKDETDCEIAGTGVENAVCTQDSDCQSGLLCLTSALGTGNCTKICQQGATGICATGTTCTAVSTTGVSPPWTHYGVCLAP